jgi:hypothetical protein
MPAHPSGRSSVRSAVGIIRIRLKRAIRALNLLLDVDVALSQIRYH